jgi:hypothetical protein
MSNPTASPPLATEVRVLPAPGAGEPYPDATFLLVETVRNRAGERLAIIDCVVRNENGWGVRCLERLDMSHLAACAWAVDYAARCGIPVVYERDSDRTVTLDTQ